LAWLLFLGLLSGCSTWTLKTRAPGHTLPQKGVLFVAIAKNVSAADDGGAVAALVDGLEAGLRARGREVEIVAAHPDEAPPVPRVELQVQSSETGDPGMRGAGNYMPLAVGVPLALSAMGKVVIDVYVVPESGPPTLSGRMTARLSSTTSGYDAVSDAEAAGTTIALNLLR
jgi:hypothetical protein